MALRILIDTNVLLDYLLCREPYDRAARDIIIACKQKRVFGCIAAHSISNMFFIMRKSFSAEERRNVLLCLCELFEVEGIDKGKILEALANDQFSDFEDCLQMECAKVFRADYIITRNCGDFEKSTIPCMEPCEFCKLI
ncbi:MAG: PIN domain-containing protein [Acetatifactor sp.]|nr:PIN domain-containing protein [Acetatifactor sp.]MDE7354059.1 PIN domain-containing protein [Acetatifactor sp.]